MRTGIGREREIERETEGGRVQQQWPRRMLIKLSCPLLPKPPDADGHLPRLIDCHAVDAGELGIERPRPQAVDPPDDRARGDPL